MNRGLLDTFLLELQHDGFDFFFGQDKIAHHHRLISHLLEGHPGAQREPRGYGHSVLHNLHVSAWQSELINIPRLHLP